MMFDSGDIVQITNKSKSKYKEAIGTVLGYCNGTYGNICRVKLWKNKTIQIFDYNLIKYHIKETQNDQKAT